jgi:hypothetical protein
LQQGGDDLKKIVVVLADQNQAGRRREFIYHDTVLESSYLAKDLAPEFSDDESPDSANQ